MASHTPHPHVFSVLFRDTNWFFFARAPVRLELHPSYVQLARYRLAHAHLSVARGLGRNELVLTARRTVLSIRPTDESLAQWPRVTRLLGLARHNPAPVAAPPRYALHEELGRGAFGLVRRATAPDGSTVAVKRVPKKRVRASPAALTCARRELHVARRLPPHPSVISVVEARETTDDFLVVMEYVPGGTLLEYVQTRRPTPRVVAHIMRQVLAAVAHLHRYGFVHRDVKLENLLVVDPNAELPTIKLCDFGLAIDERAINATRTSPGAVGTGYAQAPEMVLESAHGSQVDPYGRAVDVWACGIALFTLLYRRVPWLEQDKARSDAMRQMLELSRSSEPSIQVVQTPEERCRTPQYIHSLLCGLLQPEPKRRLSARAALEHRLFATHSQDVEPQLPRKDSFSRSDSGSPRSLRQAATDVISLLRVADTLQGRNDSGGHSRSLVVV